MKELFYPFNIDSSVLCAKSAVMDS